MKRIILILTVLLIALFSSAQEITGTWNGVLNVSGMKIRLVFHITKTDAGYTATMDSPDQGANGIPMTKATFENPELNMTMTAGAIEYSGTLKNDTVFGVFKQSGQSFPMNLSKKEIVKQEVKRKQEPSKPFPYHSEDITFENKKDKITLAGTLTLPDKKGKFPMGVLISGSGPQNRDEELMGHKPFLVLSDYLTRNGIGVLRFDDRGTYESKGDFSKATSFDFATDVEAAINYLKNRKEIDKKRIGLIGHSEGGIIAPIVAVNNKNVSFIVLMAGTGIAGDSLLILQQQAIGKASGISEKDLKISAEINRGCF
jgi:dienelactone hydrolase